MNSQIFARMALLALITVVELKPMRVAIDFSSRGNYGTYIRGHKDGSVVVVNNTSDMWVRIGQDPTNTQWRLERIGPTDSYNFIISDGTYYGNGAEVTAEQIIAKEKIEKTNAKIDALRRCVRINAKCPSVYTIGHSMCQDKLDKAYNDWKEAHGGVAPTNAEWEAIKPSFSQCYCKSNICGWQWAD
jgi:hypothetical protein